MNLNLIINVLCFASITAGVGMKHEEVKRKNEQNENLKGQIHQYKSALREVQEDKIELAEALNKQLENIRASYEPKEDTTKPAEKTKSAYPRAELKRVYPESKDSTVLSGIPVVRPGGYMIPIKRVKGRANDSLPVPLHMHRPNE